MCLSIPAKIIELNGDTAIVDIGGAKITTGIQLIESPAIGEFVLVHSGFAIAKISQEEAEEQIKVLNELGENNNTDIVD